ncbi:MAG: phytanoyl-CoA dioxygenase family protein [Caldilineaceae bacterium]|nr:phytanoyl-CoA dioxygenase family protein [Caldilineaceae bacterium]MDE0336338.1 phytanoyl-CoA dioxygenase family protein [Caldilineaceae bacterium]
MTSEQTSERIEVPVVVDQGQVEFYVDNGYLAVPNLLDAAELEALKQDIVKVARGGYPNLTIEPVPQELSDEEVLSKILAIHQPHYVSPVMEKYTRHPKISGVLSQITGAHLAHWSGNVKCMQSMLFIKPPGYPGQSWHQDENYIPTRDRSLIGAWIAIDDAYVENGCMWVIPGSQRQGYLYPTRRHGNPDEFDTHDDMATGFDESPQIPVEVKAGSVVFFNGYLLHQSLRNRTHDSYRRVLVNHYLSSESLLPWVKMPDEQPVARVDVRRVIPVAGVDPYAWKGYEKSPAEETRLYIRKARFDQD